MLTPVNPPECARFARLLGIIPGALNGEKKKGSFKEEKEALRKKKEALRKRKKL